MKARAQRWGNSLAVRIPKAIAEQVGVSEHDELDIDVAEGAIRIKPRNYSPTLDELLLQIEPGNLHGEVQTGKPQGRE